MHINDNKNMNKRGNYVMLLLLEEKSEASILKVLNPEVKVNTRFALQKKYNYMSTKVKMTCY